MRVVVFQLDDARFALPAASVLEVLRAVAVTRLPGAPPVVEGIVNVRGAVVPVLDLRARFGLPRRDLRPSDHLLLARAGDRDVLVRADRALDVRDVADAEISSLRSVVPRAPHVAGVLRLEDGLVLLHDLAAFLAEAEAAALDAALGARGGPDEGARTPRGTP